MDKELKRTGTLSREAVDLISEQIGTFLASSGKDKRDALQLRLRMEDLILDVCERYEEPCSYTLETGQRFRRPYIRFIYEGERYNPLEDSGEAVLSGNWSNKLLADIGLSPVWTYRNNRNVLQLKLDRKALGMFRSVALAFVLALAVGFGGMALPDAARNILTAAVFEPVQSIYMGILATFSGLMIFFSIICGIFEMGDTSFFSRIGKRMVGRFLGNTFLFALFYAAAAFLVFPLHYVSQSAGGGGVSQLTEMLLNVFPTNPVEPFLTGNTMQIVFLGVVIGVAILVMGEEGSRSIRSFAEECNTLIQKVIGRICGLVPVFIFVTFVLIIWQGRLRAWAACGNCFCLPQSAVRF